MSSEVALPRLSRRHVIAGLAGLVVLPHLSHAATIDGPIVTLDYGTASTLLALGVTPAAVASLADWQRWVIEPAMPGSVIDLGSSWEVNFEVLADLKPGLILITPFLESLRPQLEAIGPVASLSIYTPDGGKVLDQVTAATRDLAVRIGREPEAERFLQQADAMFDHCHARIAAIGPPPLALINFMDARHARIYAGVGLYQGVMDRIGLTNAWTGETDYWGYQTIGLEQLGTLPSADILRLVAFEPVPRDTLPVLDRSPLWTSLPFVRAGRVSTLPAVLMFGMVNEALRFARLLTAHLEQVA